MFYPPIWAFLQARGNGNRCINTISATGLQLAGHSCAHQMVHNERVPQVYKYKYTNTNTQIQIQIWIPKHSYACTKHQMIHLHYIFSKYTNFVCLYSRWWQWWQGCWIQFCFTWKIMRSIFFHFMTFSHLRRYVCWFILSKCPFHVFWNF